jgi:hypothetical protein
VQALNTTPFCKQQQPKKKKGVKSMEEVVTIKIQTKKKKQLCIEELQVPHPLESNNTKKKTKKMNM